MHLLCCFLTVCLLMFIVHKSSRAKCAALCCCRAVTTLQSWEPPSSAGSLGHRDCPEPSKAPFVYLTRLQAQLKQSPHSPHRFHADSRLLLSNTTKTAFGTNNTFYCMKRNKAKCPEFGLANSKHYTRSLFQTSNMSLFCRGFMFIL